MSSYFLDSSALVKRYPSEVGSAWTAALTDPLAGNSIVVAEISRVEIAAAFAARSRAPGGITQVERDRLFGLLVRHNTLEYEVIPISTQIVDRAMNLTQKHRLRGYDAVQLAAALDVQAAARAAGLPTLVFLTANEDLLTAAFGEGLAADNPNHHP